MKDFGFFDHVAFVHQNTQLLFLHDKIFHSEHNEAMEQAVLRGCAVNTKLEHCKMNSKFYKG